MHDVGYFIGATISTFMIMYGFRLFAVKYPRIVLRWFFNCGVALSAAIFILSIALIFDVEQNLGVHMFLLAVWPIVFTIYDFVKSKPKSRS